MRSYHEAGSLSGKIYKWTGRYPERPSRKPLSGKTYIWKDISGKTYIRKNCYKNFNENIMKIQGVAAPCTPALGSVF